MLNHIVIMGRLTRDPELRRTGSGIAVAGFTLAVDRDYSSKDGGERETDFIDCVAWRQTGEFVSKYFTKGRMAVVSGRLQIRNWTDKDGGKRRTAEIVTDNVYFGDSKRTDQQDEPQQAGGMNHGQNNYLGGAPQGYGLNYGGTPQDYPKAVYPQQNYQQQGFGGYQQNYPYIPGDGPKLPF